MPNSMVDKVSKKLNVSKSDVEDLWDEAKYAAAKQKRFRDFAYITGIFKKLIQAKYGNGALIKLGWKKPVADDKLPKRDKEKARKRLQQIRKSLECDTTNTRADELLAKLKK